MQNSKKTLCVIDPGVRVAEVECFNELASASPIPATYHLPALFGTRSLEAVKEAAGIIILGSGSSVHDPLPWRESLSHWLLPKMKAGTPTLGLCYGHQLVAHLFGANVEFLNPAHGKVEGERLTEVKPGRIFEKMDRRGPLTVSHREIVTTVPEGFEILATSSTVKIDGLFHSRLPIWTFQSHPEANSAFVANNLSVSVGPEAFAYGGSIVRAFLATL